MWRYGTKSAIVGKKHIIPDFSARWVGKNEVTWNDIDRVELKKLKFYKDRIKAIVEAKAVRRLAKKEKLMFDFYIQQRNAVIAWLYKKAKEKTESSQKAIKWHSGQLQRKNLSFRELRYNGRGLFEACERLTADEKIEAKFKKMYESYHV